MNDHIRRLIEDRDKRIEKLQAEIKRLKEHPKSDPSREKAIAAAEARLNSLREAYERMISSAQNAEEAETIKDKIRSSALAERQAKEAKRRDANLKFRAWKVFFANGGSKDEFEKQWPVIREKMLQDEATQAVRNEAAQAVRKPQSL